MRKSLTAPQILRGMALASLLAVVFPLAPPLWGQTSWVWQPMPMLSPSEQAAGIYPGGEGCQYPQIIAIDASDGSFLLYGTDVGGWYRSTNGGLRFQPCNVGVETTGGVGFAIDPRNRNRCLGVGDGGGNQYNIYGGVHLSTNQGATWSRTLSKWLDGNYNGDITKGREQIAYDPSSFNASLGYCTIAYWVEEGNPQESGGRLYKTTNGGSSWTAQASPASYGGADGAHSQVKVHPALGYVYLANTNGFYRSTNGGASFTQMLSGSFKSLDLVPTLPDTVWLAQAGTARIWKSTDAGATFASFTATGIGQILALKVSPANPNRLLAVDASKNNQRFYSANGGTNWVACGKDMTLSWIPASILYDDRCRSQVWHPTNASLAWGIGPGDIIAGTTNGGVTFTWANNGNNGIMLGGGFNFNTRNPDILYFGSQDYNGGLTTNGGKTWNFINLSVNNYDGDPWGWVYGAYAADSQLLFGGNRAYNQSTYQLWISFNGGVSSSAKVSNLTGLQVSYGDPTDTNVLFCWSYRSGDRGQNWSQMAGCQGVLTHDRLTQDLYGANSNQVVKSADHGLTWSVVATLSGNVQDVAVAAASNRLYVAAAGKLWRCDAPGFVPLQVASLSGGAVSVAVDPQDQSCLYVAGATGTWRKGDNAVMRSSNGGTSWEKLNNRADLKYDGGNCASWCRVHPQTRDLWVGTICYGFWRFGPQAKLVARLQPGTAATATLSWSGGAPPFTLETAPAVPAAQWTSLLTNHLNSATVPLTNSLQVFRVRAQAD